LIRDWVIRKWAIAIGGGQWSVVAIMPTTIVGLFVIACTTGITSTIGIAIGAVVGVVNRSSSSVGSHHG